MKKNIQISIPKPCHENWQKMTPAEQGRFCDSCQKKVYDFTLSPDREIVAAIAKDNQLCGRFRGDQLERNLIVPKEKSTLWIAAGAAVFGFLTLGTNKISAQDPLRTEQHESEEMLGKVAPVIKKTTISGTVSDESGPLPGTTVINKTSRDTIAADMEGVYQIDAKPGDILEFSYAGYETKNITAGTSSTFNVHLGSPMMGIVHLDVYGKLETKECAPKERTLFGRIFHSIGSLFRKK